MNTVMRTSAIVLVVFISTAAVHAESQKRDIRIGGAVETLLYEDTAGISFIPAGRLYISDSTEPLALFAGLGVEYRFTGKEEYTHHSLFVVPSIGLDWKPFDAQNTPLSRVFLRTQVKTGGGTIFSDNGYETAALFSWLVKPQLELWYDAGPVNIGIATGYRIEGSEGSILRAVPIGVKGELSL